MAAARQSEAVQYTAVLPLELEVNFNASAVRRRAARRGIYGRGRGRRRRR